MAAGGEMTLGSLLSGVGGFDLGWERSGGKIAWQVERDPYRRAVLARQWPCVPRFDDLLRLYPGSLLPADCLTLDCPTHRYRTAHPLFQKACQIVAALRPRFVLMQMVIAARYRDDGQDWDPVREALQVLGYRIAPVQCSYAAPDRRMYWERQFVLGYRDTIPPLVWPGVNARMHQGPPEAPDCLNYGQAREGDIVAGEADWLFPAGWTEVPGATVEQRCRAVMDSTPVDVGEWWGKALGEKTE